MGVPTRATDASFGLGLWFGRRAGDLLYVLLAGRRHTALENLGLAFPDRSPSEHRAICRGSFQQLGMMLVEAVVVLWKPSAMVSRITLEGREHLTEALAGSPAGALIVTAHLGNWELLSLAGRLTGLAFATVVRPLDVRFLNRFAERLRASAGIERIGKRRAARAILDALRGGRVVGILLDQNTARSEGVFVPFFGRPASTSRGLALLSLRAGVPILPAFIHREPDGRHRIVIETAIRLPASGSLETAVAEVTAECVRRIEAAIRRWPDQWFWLHRRWRTRPVEERVIVEQEIK
jgi:Kdo2-lipid IVA lauroyltransferase/acyltransferase